MNTKHWTSEEVAEVADYIRNLRSPSYLLRLHDRTGRLASTIEKHTHKAADELLRIVGYADGDQDRVDGAVETWIAVYLIDGGRAKLLAALRKRRERAERAEAKAEQAERGTRSRRRKPETLDEALAEMRSWTGIDPDVLRRAAEQVARERRAEQVRQEQERQRQEQERQRQRQRPRRTSAGMTYAEALAVLGLATGANQVSIRRAYRVAAQTYHPDRPQGDAERFKRAKRAYDTLRAAA